MRQEYIPPNKTLCSKPVPHEPTERLYGQRAFSHQNGALAEMIQEEINTIDKARQYKNVDFTASIEAIRNYCQTLKQMAHYYGEMKDPDIVITSEESKFAGVILCGPNVIDVHGPPCWNICI